ncbi:MAG: redoxin domain-containing protein [Planctomycetales bacterium]|nr:redoxin domain-containing protein [Planctomycetales bacterium]
MRLVFTLFSSQAISHFALAAIIALAFTVDISAESPARKPASQIDGFTLADSDGRERSLTELRAERPFVVVAFLGVECPLVKLYAGRLADLAERYRDRVAFVGINSNQQDSLAELTHFVRTQNITFPILKDPGNRVADQFGARRTPEIFVLDDQGTVRYHGRIDDQYTYGLQRPQVDHEYLKEALDALLADKPVSITNTETVGCHIGRVLTPREDSDVTYSRQISRILRKHCVECHRPGEIGPFSLQNYDEVVGWAEMIDEVVSEQRMPPWHANPEHGNFSNEARLSEEEKRQIREWVSAGAPKGDPTQLPAPREFTEGWRIGTPDVVISMSDKPFTVPARGEVPYKYFQVDPGFTEDKWIQAAECRPGNRAVVHHIIVAVAPQDGGRRGAHNIESHWLTATAPGARPMILPEGYAKFVPAGAKLVFQMHYTTNGTEAQDLSSVGFRFADPKTVRKVVGTDAASARHKDLVIPANASNHRVEATHTFAKDSQVVALFPHMHLRGKAFRYTAIHQDGSREVLLDIPHYDFNWQNSYILENPKLMRSGDRMYCEAWYDNSEDNLANPNPTKEVRWGDQSWDEMMIGYFDMVLADQDLQAPATTSSRPRTERFLATHASTAKTLSPELLEAAAAALDSPETMDNFGLEVVKLIPQLDRICWTTVEEDTLHVRRVIQRPEFTRQVGGAGRSFATQGLQLPKYASETELIIHANLAHVIGKDFEFMSRTFSSSLHIPIRHGGVSGTLNFWSTEPDAFPSSAAKICEQISRPLK